MTKENLLDFLAPFHPDMKIYIELPNGDLVRVKNFYYTFLRSQDEAIVVLSGRKPKQPFIT